MPARHPAAIARMQLVAAGLLWSLGGLFVKAINDDAISIAGGRALVAGLVLLPFVRRLPSSSLLVVISASLVYAINISVFVWTNQMTSAANAIILQYTAPAFVFLFQLLLKRDAANRRDVITLGGGMLGVLCIYLGSDPSELLGIGLGLVTGITFALWMVIMRNAKDADPISMIATSSFVTVLLVSPLALVSDWSPPGTRTMIALIAMGAIQLGLPYVLFGRGVKVIAAQEASLIVLIEPVLNPLWVFLFVAEVPATGTIIGGGIILLSLVIRYTIAARILPPTTDSVP
jgi:drug/metabolite transporter (DMT)-like permease